MTNREPDPEQTPDRAAVPPLPLPPVPTADQPPAPPATPASTGPAGAPGAAGTLGTPGAAGARQAPTPGSPAAGTHRPAGLRGPAVSRRRAKSSFPPPPPPPPLPTGVAAPAELSEPTEPDDDLASTSPESASRPAGSFSPMSTLPAIPGFGDRSSDSPAPAGPVDADRAQRPSSPVPFPTATSAPVASSASTSTPATAAPAARVGDQPDGDAAADDFAASERAGAQRAATVGKPPRAPKQPRASRPPRAPRPPAPTGTSASMGMGTGAGRAPGRSRAGAGAVLALVLGIVALLIAFVPIASYVAVPVAIAGLVLGIVALGRRRGRGPAAGGVIVAGIALVAALAVSVVTTVGILAVLPGGITADRPGAGGAATAPASPPDAGAGADAGALVPALYAQTVTYDDGLQISVSEPVAFEPSSDALGADQAQNVSVSVTVYNGSAAAFTPQPEVSVRSGDAEGTTIVDVLKQMNGLRPSDPIEPGSTVTWVEGYSVPDAADVVYEIAPSPAYLPARFTG